MKSAYFGLTALTALAAAGAGAAQTPEAGSPIALEEITITAQRVSENLQKAAIAVSAVSGDAVESRGVTRPDDISRLVPALVVQPTGGPGNNFYLRGIGAQGASAFAENVVAFNVDGVFVGRPVGVVGYFYDLERLEVLKGPQGTLYGRNATGGAINVITRKPEMGLMAGNLNVGYGNYDDIRVNGAVNLPLGDKAALRLAGQYVTHDGYLSDGYDDEDLRAVRAQLRLEPTDGVSVLLSANYAHQDGKGPGSVLANNSLVPGAPSPEDRIGGADPRSLAALQAAFPTLYNSQSILPPRGDGYIDADYAGVGATIEIATPLGELTVIPNYQELDSELLGYRPGFSTFQTEKAEQKSLEVRLASDDERALRYVVGAYYFDQDQKATQSYTQGRNVIQQARLGLGTTSYAAFTQLTLAMSERLRLVGGLRYTREDKTQNSLIRSISPISLNPPFTPVPGKLSFDNVTGKVGLEFDVTPDSLLYASVATGFKAGGFFGSVGANTFEPEKLTAFTVGSKNQFLDNRLRLNLEVFYWDYKDQQITYLGGAQTSPGIYANAGLTENIGQARLYGFEAEAEYLLTSNDRVSANVQYLNSEYTDFHYQAFSANGLPPSLGCTYAPSRVVPINAARFFDVDCSGKPAVNAPEWSLTLGYQHVFELASGDRILANLATKLETSRYLSIEYLPAQRQDAYSSTDASLRFEKADKRWYLEGWINNIEDSVQRNQAVIRPVVNTVYIGLKAPRTYGIRAGVSF